MSTREDRKEWLEQIEVASKSMSTNDNFSDEEKLENRDMIERRKLYLSPETISLDAYILAGLCFKIFDRCKGNVKFYFTTRAKSPESSLKKQERFNKQLDNGDRKDAKIYDFIASKFVIEMVGSDKSSLKTFSSEVKSLFDEREENIDLLASIIDFFNQQAEIGSFYSEYDNKKTLSEKVNVLKNTFNEDFKQTVSKYRSEFKPSRPNLETDILQIIQELRLENETDKVEQFYMKIRKFLIAEQTVPNDMRDDQEEYFKYLIVLLGSLRKLEYKECAGSYKDIEDSLKRTILTFSNLIDTGFNDNVTLEYLEELEKWCKKLNSQLSDKLQSQMIEELMQDTMCLEFIEPDLSVSMEENPINKGHVEKQCKSNGYVSLHCKIVQTIEKKLKLFLELQGMTKYRSKVATYGSASYGEKRMGKKASNEKVRAEKERPIYLMPEYREGLKYTDSDGKLKREIVIRNMDKIETMTDDKLKKWKNDIERVTPRYFNTTFNPENDSVEFTFHSMYQNARMYFREINNRKKKHRIDEGFEIIKEHKLLDDNEHTITLSRSKYEQFLQENGLEKLIDEIIKKYYQYEQIVAQEENDGR